MKNINIIIAEKIAGYIVNNNKREVNEGLMSGNMGICMFLYHLYEKTYNEQWKIYADNLLNTIFSKQSMMSSVNFQYGLSGIGWCVEYLIRNDLCEGDTNEILEDVDTYVFKIINEQKIKQLNLEDGLTGFLLYIASRLKNTSTLNATATRINHGLLIKIINKIDEVAPNIFQDMIKDVQFYLFWEFPVLFLALKEALSLGIYNEKIVNMVNQWMYYLESHLPGLYTHRLSLALALHSINEYMESDNIRRHINTLLYSIQYEDLIYESNPYQINIQYGSFGIALLLSQAENIFTNDFPKYKHIKLAKNKLLLAYLNDFENSIQNMEAFTKASFGVCTGLSGIGLLYLLYPEAVSLQ